MKLLPSHKGASHPSVRSPPPTPASTRDGMLRVRGLATRLHVAQPGLIRRFHDVMTAGRNGMPDPPSTLPQPLQLYLRSMHTSPMVTGTVSAGCAATAGDGIARIVAWAMGDTQVAQGISRTAYFAGWSALAVGVGGRLWYRALLRKFPGETYEVALRTCLDLSFFSPVVFGLSVAGLTWVQTGSEEMVAIKLRDDWLQYLGKLWLTWGVGSYVSYMAVPTPWQPPFALGLSLGWFSYVSYRVHRTLDSEEFDQSHLVTEYLQKAQKG